MLMLMPPPPPSFPRALAVSFLFSILCLHGSLVQGQPKTDPVQVAALNAIFRRWGISSSQSPTPWNTTGDPCSGAALDGVKIYDDDSQFNPAIICECSNTTCNIVRLKAHNLNIVGTIPDELQNLRQLNNLQIGRNDLTGPLPTFIGNFSEMLYLSIGLNSLSGPLPKELGNLKKLISLGLGSRNNFSGPLPPELGNLTNLEQMYMDSNGLSGEIPSTFANLAKLKILWASDNDFGGKMPDFIGNLTNLQSLKLEGNSFEGPIPSSFSNLVGLNELRLCDLSKGISSLSFIRNMKSLATLILRDSGISDTIPSDIGNYNGLKHLDLSFNNLTGQLPQSLFNMEKLENLYLGNNSLSGNLPESKSATLKNIDLSYNELSGSFPSWVNEDNLQLNLVANNFVIDKSTRGLQWELRCLQRDVPCFLGKPVYYSFAVNCGGSESVYTDENNGTDYEADFMDLSSASYRVTSTQRWAVSSVGNFLEAPDPKYTVNSLSSFLNASNPKLFQSTRLSPSSLRYYGLALENGNYTITLQFAETSFSDNFTWKSFGRRVFDIYIQGDLVAKDFDIRHAAGGRSFTAIKRTFVTSVTKNFLEVHFLWAGKGTCCIPEKGSYGPSISAISIYPNFLPTVPNKLPKNKSNTALIAGLVTGITVAVFLIILCIICIKRKKRRHALMADDEELRGLTSMPNSFSYLELRTATQDFNPANKLGEGGFGPVYKGKLDDGTIVAVKQLLVSSLHGKAQFVTEIATISAVKHRNLVKLFGCCYEGDKRLLVYEFLENGSLDRALFGKSNLKLDWTSRFNICLGTARGLAYLHEESRVRIVHRDIKASNILLDTELNPKISDFGLAKLYDENVTHMSTRVAGTIGYLAPEYAMRGHLTEKADIFGFGVVVLEILCGRSNTDGRLEAEKVYLLEWAWQLHESGHDLKMLDPTLKSLNEEEVRRMIGVAFMCTQANPLLRPTMSRVVAMLVGDAEIGEVPKPTYLSDWQFEGDFTDQFSTTMDLTTGETSGQQSLPSQKVMGGDGR